MKPIAYDVYICCREPSGDGLALVVSAGLTRLGFRVFVGHRMPGSIPDEQRLRLIEDTPDFVLLYIPDPGDGGGAEPDLMRDEIAHAFKTNRNVLVVSEPENADQLVHRLPPALPALASWQRVVYDAGRSKESIAVLGHRLLSSSEVEDRRLMRTAKRALIASGLILLAAIAIKAVPAVAEFWNRPKPKPPLPPFVLYWCTFGQRLVAGRWMAFTPGDGSAGARGDQIRLAFSPSADGFAYAVSRDVRGDVAVLFPVFTIRGASRVRGGEVYEIPAGGGWLPVDPQSGIDTIYLLAGYDPLENLEELVDEADTSGTPAGRRELLVSTVAGILDGRHAAVQPPVRTRSRETVLEGLAVRPGPPACSATLSGGTVVTRRFTAQRGLVSAVVEFRVRAGGTP